jgi:hypothetical protein
MKAKMGGGSNHGQDSFKVQCYTPSKNCYEEKTLQTPETLVKKPIMIKMSASIKFDSDIDKLKPVHDAACLKKLKCLLKIKKTNQGKHQLRLYGCPIPDMSVSIF